MLKRLLFAIVAVLSVPMSANADLVFHENNVSHVLLVVDVSDPSNVKFTATENPPSDNQMVSNTVGVRLEDLATLRLSTDQPVPIPISGNLTPAGANLPPYDLALDVSGSLPLPDFDLIRSVSPTGGIQNFDVNSPAFTGMSSGDFSEYTLALPGASGNILADGTVIGTWVAVPEPSAFLNVGLISSIVGCGVWAKRRFV